MYSLQKLAAAGIPQFPPAELATLFDWCWDYGESTGDARYCSLSRSIQVINELFEPYGAVPTELINSLDGVLAARLVTVISAPSPEAGSKLAKALRQEIDQTIAASRVS